MAYTKKNVDNNSSKTVKKESTKEVVTTTNEPIVNETVIEEVKEPRKFEQTDGIRCRSLVSGALYITGMRSGIPYTWADYNDVQEVEYRDLIYMVRSRGDKSIYAPRIIVEDDDFISQNKELETLYSSMYTTSDLRDIVKLPVRTMIAEINKLPQGAKESLKSIVSTMIDSHELDSVQKIKAIDELFGTRLLLTMAQE